jgi:release factor glutamine methyltransferase
MGEGALRQAAATRRESFVVAAAALRRAGIATPELDARLLLCHAAGISQETYVADPERALAGEAQALYGRLIGRRLDGEPVSRIFGWREFYGRAFQVDRHTLDPRPDTETLIEAALALVARRGAADQSLRLLDLGTGTGCILLTLLAELPGATGVGTDVSAPALLLAHANAQHLGVEARARFLAGDWLQPVAGRFDLIVANPPYLATAEIGRLPREVAAYDPRLALDGGADGLNAYRRIVARAAEVLKPGGAIVLEIGSTQSDAVFALLAAAGLGIDAEGSLWHDLGGHPRVVLAHV